MMKASNNRRQYNNDHDDDDDVDVSSSSYHRSSDQQQQQQRLPRYAVSRLVGHDVGPIQTVVFTADGKYCLTGGYDRTVRLWNPARLDPAYPASITTVPNHNDKNNEYNSNQQQQLVSNLPRALPIQSYADGLTHPITSIAVCQQHQQKQEQQHLLLSACDKTAVITDIVTGKAIRRIQTGHYSRINRVAFSTDAETYLTASYDATVRIWDGRNHRSYEPIQILKDAKDSVTSIHTAQSESMALIRTSSVDGIVRTYDIRMGMVQCDDCYSPIISLAPTCDGKCIAISCLDGKIRLMDCNSGELLNTYYGGHIAGKYSLDCAITANDNTIVTGSENGDTILYDIVQANAVVRKLQGIHTAPTCAVATHPNRSDALITASYDGNAIVWAHDIHFMSWNG